MPFHHLPVLGPILLAQPHDVDHEKVAVGELNHHHFEWDAVLVRSEEEDAIRVAKRLGLWVDRDSAVRNDMQGPVSAESMSGS